VDGFLCTEYSSSSLTSHSAVTVAVLENAISIRGTHNRSTEISDSPRNWSMLHPWSGLCLGQVGQVSKTFRSASIGSIVLILSCASGITDDYAK